MKISISHLEQEDLTIESTADPMTLLIDGYPVSVWGLFDVLRPVVGGHEWQRMSREGDEIITRIERKPRVIVL